MAKSLGIEEAHGHLKGGVHKVGKVQHPHASVNEPDPRTRMGGKSV